MADKQFEGVLLQSSGSPVTRSEIDAMCRSCGVALPTDYMEFLIAVNGGSPRPNGFKFVRPSLSDQSSHETMIASLIEESDCIADPNRKAEILDDVRLLQNVKIPRRVAAIWGIESIPGTLQTRLEMMSGNDDWVVRLLPIGSDENDTPFLLSLNTEDFGAVYCFYPDSGAPKIAVEGAKWAEEFLVATSFYEFLTRLFPARVECAPGYAPSQRQIELFRLDEYAS